MRKHYTAAERRRFLDEVRQTGEPIRVVAQRMGIGVSTAYSWHQRLNGASESAKLKPKFARVVRSTEPFIVVQVGAAKVHVQASFDAELLRRVVEALEKP